MRMQRREKHREGWLVAAAKWVSEEVFEPAGFEVPPAVRLSVGWPLGCRPGKVRQHSIGQCWSFSQSADGHCEIFISPEVDDAAEVLGVLVHEIVHAVVGVEHGHKAAFKRCALAVGLEGKMTSTTVGEELGGKLSTLVKLLGEYPHARLAPGDGHGRKKQGTRLLKVYCPTCGYTARVAGKWIDVGMPICPCGQEWVCDEVSEDE